MNTSRSPVPNTGELWGREHLLSVGLKTLGVVIGPILWDILLFVLWPPMMPGHGNATSGTILIQYVLYFGVWLFVLPPLLGIWGQWLKRGVYLDPDTNVLTLTYPTNYGLGTSGTQKIGPVERRIENTSVGFPASLFWHIPHIDDIPSVQDFDTWPMTRGNAERLYALSTAAPRIEGEENGPTDEGMAEGTAGDAWFRETIILFARALIALSPTLGNVLLLVDDFADDDDHASTREQIRKSLVAWAFNPTKMRQDLGLEPKQRKN